MTTSKPPKLPPMTAIEFAVENAFRYYFFGLRLILIWSIALLPVAGATYYFGVTDGLSELITPNLPAGIALSTLLLIGVLAIMSISVNWHRRVILNEKPRGLGWIGLGSIVWHYFVTNLFLSIPLAMIAAVIAAATTILKPAIESYLGAASKPTSYVVLTLLFLFLIFTGYRLRTLLPAVAIADRDYTLRSAWIATRNNRFRFVVFTFWAGFIGLIVAGFQKAAEFAMGAFENFYVTIAIYSAIFVISVWSFLFGMTVSSSHYVHFSGKGYGSDGKIASI